MVVVPDVFIIRVKSQWLKSTRPDLLGDPAWREFSLYVNDAKRFKNLKDAKREARKYAGKIFQFNPATQAIHEVINDIQNGACCGNCGKYTPISGLCRNPDSENYREPVLCKMSCEEWEGKRCG